VDVRANGVRRVGCVHGLGHAPTLADVDGEGARIIRSEIFGLDQAEALRARLAELRAGS
jgi:hypothetical protein